MIFPVGLLLCFGELGSVAEGWSDGKVIDENFSRFIFVSFSFFFILLVKNFSLIESTESIREISSKGFAWSTWINFALILCLLVGVAPMLNFGPFSNTWSKLFSGLQTYSVVGKAGTTLEKRSR